MMEQTNLNIGTIGQKLQNARLARHETVSDAARNTRILKKVVEAMESDDFSSISAPVYAKGFLKLYAQYLGLDSAPLLDEYLQLYTNKPKPLLTKEVEQNLTRVETGEAKLPQKAGKVFPGKTKEFVSSATGRFRLSEITPKMWLTAGTAFVLLVILLIGLSRCSVDKGAAPVPDTVEPASRELLFDTAPDVYLIQPGVVDVKQRSE